MKSKHIELIDSLKGFAIFLVVIGHCFVGYLNAGMFKEIEFEIKFLNDFIYSFHMPLFFIISGFLFYYTYGRSNFNKAKMKIFDFILIYFVYSILQIIIQIILSQSINQSLSVKSILYLPIYTVAPYWYLYVLVFLYLISYSVIEFRIDKVLCASFFLCIASEYLPHVRMFCFSQICYYLFFFTLGGYLCVRNVDLRRFTYLVPMLICSLIILYSFNILTMVPKSFLAIIICLVILISFAKFKFLNTKFFLWCGKYCLPIYLFHIYLTAGTRVLLRYFKCDLFWLYFISGTVLGVVIPVLVYKICMSNDFLKLCFVPSRMFNDNKI